MKKTRILIMISSILFLLSASALQARTIRIVTPYLGAINILNHQNILHYYWIREAGIETVDNPTDAKMRIIIMYPRFVTMGLRIKF